MANESWEEHKLLIMDKLETHSAEIGVIRDKVDKVELSFQIGMIELRSKIMTASAFMNVLIAVVVTIVAAYISKGS